MVAGNSLWHALLQLLVVVCALPGLECWVQQLGCAQQTVRCARGTGHGGGGRSFSGSLSPDGGAIAGKAQRFVMPGAQQSRMGGRSWVGASRTAVSGSGPAGGSRQLPCIGKLKGSSSWRPAGPGIAVGRFAQRSCSQDRGMWARL